MKEARESGKSRASISLTPVEILDGQNEFVTVTLVYESDTPGTVPPEPPTDPEQANSVAHVLSLTTTQGT